METDKPRSTQLKLYTTLLIIGWTLAIITSVLWNIHLQNEETREVALNVARTQLENDSLYRRWNVMHGGIYVPVTDENPPDEHLAGIPERDITTPSGQPLTLTSHAYMMEQVYRLAAQKSRITRHIASLDPIRLDSPADEWETEALHKFEQGQTEVSTVVELGNEPHMRLMKPFIIEKACLKCHSQQGYKVGDIRGGISVTLPMSLFQKANERQIFTLIWGHILWWILGVFVIGIGYFNMRKRIEERQKAEEEMTNIRFYLQNIIDSMPSVLVGVDLEGRITLWNDEAEKMTSSSSSQVKGEFINSIFPFLEGQMEKIKSAMLAKTPLSIEKQQTVSKGGIRFFDVMSYPLISHNVEGAVIRLDDVTTRTFMEEKEAQADKMSSVAGLAEGMAHEINNPLGGIMQGAQSVLRRVSPALAKNSEVARECGTDLDNIREYMQKRKIFDFLDGIRSSGERAASIVSYMQQFSRCQDARKEIRNLSYLAERALELISNDHNFINDVPFYTVDLIKEFDPDLPDILCSPLEVEQVIVNLIKNAAQALLEDDAVVDPQIILRVYAENGEAIIEVEDNGPGLSEDIARRIFEPFFTTKPPGKGTGLGLAVAYFIITVAHQGSLTVESIAGQGANFRIRIPLGIEQIY